MLSISENKDWAKGDKKWGMRFEIDEVTQHGHMTIVAGRNSVGRLKGIWKYELPPVIGKGYHVELSIDSPCQADIVQKKRVSPSIYFVEDTVIFQGICEDMDEDVYYIRFDIDWIEMLDINTIASQKKKGEYLSFSANVYGISIYPYTL